MEVSSQFTWQLPWGQEEITLTEYWQAGAPSDEGTIAFMMTDWSLLIAMGKVRNPTITAYLGLTDLRRKTHCAPLSVHLCYGDPALAWWMTHANH